MAAVWPPSLPQSPLVEAYDEQLADTTLRTQMDAGPAKARRRYATGVGNLTVQMFMNETQQQTFWSFFETTIAGGALRFEFTHPRLDTSVECRIVPRATLPKLRPGLYQLRMNLEVLP